MPGAKPRVFKHWLYCPPKLALSTNCPAMLYTCHLLAMGAWVKKAHKGSPTLQGTGPSTVLPCTLSLKWGVTLCVGEGEAVDVGVTE